MKLAFVYVTDEGGFDLAACSALSLALAQKHPCDIHVFCHRFILDIGNDLARTYDDLQATVFTHNIADPALEAHQIHGHVTTPSLLKFSAMDALVG